MTGELILNSLDVARFINLSQNTYLKQCVIYRKSWHGSVALMINCMELDIALKIWDDCENLFEIAQGLSLGDWIIIQLLGERFRPPYRPKHLDKPPSTIKMNTSNILLERVQKHADLIRAIGSHAVAVTLHDASDDFKYLELYTLDKRRLNKQREEVLNQPASIVDPRIAEPRIFHIKEALKNGFCQEYSYQYDDHLHWEFNVTVSRLHGTDEIITIVSDVYTWQAEYWRNLKATLPR